MKSKRKSPMRRIMPGSVSVPIMECDLPLPVWPYAKIDALKPQNAYLRAFQPSAVNTYKKGQRNCAPATLLSSRMAGAKIIALIGRGVGEFK